MEKYTIIKVTPEFIREILDTEHEDERGWLMYGSKPEHYGLFYWKEPTIKGDKEVWIGCDNTTGECYIEEFGDDVGHCLAWLIGEEDA